MTIPLIAQAGNPIHYYDFNEGTGSTMVLDQIGVNPQHGTFDIGMNAGSDWVTSGVAGGAGALHFSGVRGDGDLDGGQDTLPFGPARNVVNFGSDASFNLVPAGTIMFWYKQDPGPSGADIANIAVNNSLNSNWIVHKGDEVIGAHDYIVHNQPSQNLHFSAEMVGAAGGAAHASTDVLGTNTWHHAAVSWTTASGGLLALYVDGVAVASTPGYNGHTVTPAPFYVGGDPEFTGRGRGFLGDIDELKVFNSFLDAAAVTQAMTVGGTPESRWSSPVLGDWNAGSNWIAGVPNSIGEVASFGAVNAAPTSANSDVPVTLGTLKFDSPNSYVIGGAGSLTLQVATGSALVSVLQGTHKINLPTVVASDTTADVAAGATLVIADPLTVDAGRIFTKTGAGTIEIISTVDGTGVMTFAVSAGTANAARDLGTDTALHASGGVTNLNVTQHLASVNVTGSGVVALAAGGTRTLETKQLMISGVGALHMNDNDMIVNYAVGDPSPEFTLRDKVLQARDVQTDGIFFTRTPDDDTILAFGEASELAITSFNGIAVDGDTIVGKYTYYGDANFDGQVTTDDYVAVDLGLGTGNSWVEGDFDLNGVVTSDDYVVVDLNLGKGSPTPLAFAELKAEMIALHTAMFGDEYVQKLAYAEANGFAALVPEPACTAVGGAVACAMLRRRRDRTPARSQCRS